MISGAVMLRTCAVAVQDCTRSLQLATGSRARSLPTLIVLALSGIKSSKRRLASPILKMKMTACEPAVVVDSLADSSAQLSALEASVHAAVHIGFAACLLSCMLELLVCNPPKLLPSCLYHWVLQLMHLLACGAY